MNHKDVTDAEIQDWIAKGLISAEDAGMHRRLMADMRRSLRGLGWMLTWNLLVLAVIVAAVVFR